MTRIDDCIWDACPVYINGWPEGPPRGVLFHFSIGCQPTELVAEDLRSRGSSVHFLIGKNPANDKTRQLVELENAAIHANEASYYYYGLLHIAYPGTCDFTIEQLTESARISAELVKFIKKQWDVTIPLVRAPGNDFTPGFKEHRDGLGAVWNEDNYSDGLYTLWTWPEYLAMVTNFLEEDDFMALFKDLSDFRRNILFALGGSDEHGNPNLTQDEIRTSLEFLSGINKRMEEKDRPDYGNKQNGWDFAEKLLSVEAQTAVPLDGFIKGTIHLGAK